MPAGDAAVMKGNFLSGFFSRLLALVLLFVFVVIVSCDHVKSLGTIDVDTGSMGNSDTDTGGDTESDDDTDTDFDEGSWFEQTDMPFASGSLTSAMLSDGLHVLGGSPAFQVQTINALFSDHYVYSTYLKTWSSLPANTPDVDTWGAKAHAYNGKIYLVGGWPNGDNAFRVYDLATNSWETLPAIPSSYSYAFASAVVGDFLYVAGGRNGPDVNAPMYKYDFISGRWSQCADIPQNLNYGSFSAAVWETKIYVMGGDTPGGSTILQIYDTVSDEWSRGADLGAHFDAAAGAAVAGKLYFFGGVEQGAFFVPPLRSEVNIYDIATDSWSVGAQMPTPRAFSTAQVVGDSIHVLGGFDVKQEGLATHEVFYP